MKKLFFVSLLSIVLYGCGGGSNDSAPVVNTPVVPVVPIVAPELSKLIITGVVAKGYAIEGATVFAKCFKGVGTGKTDINGQYKLEVSAGKLPCVLESMELTDNSKLHSFAIGTGLLSVSNITTLTDLVAARLYLVDPTSGYARIDFTTLDKAVTATTIEAATAEVVFILNKTVDTTAIPNFFESPLKAATLKDKTSGNLHDKVLDNLLSTFGSNGFKQVLSLLSYTRDINSVKTNVVKLVIPPVTVVVPTVPVIPIIVTPVIPVTPPIIVPPIVPPVIVPPVVLPVDYITKLITPGTNQTYVRVPLLEAL